MTLKVSFILFFNLMFRLISNFQKPFSDLVNIKFQIQFSGKKLYNSIIEKYARNLISSHRRKRKQNINIQIQKQSLKILIMLILLILILLILTLILKLLLFTIRILFILLQILNFALNFIQFVYMRMRIKLHKVNKALLNIKNSNFLRQKARITSRKTENQLQILKHLFKQIDPQNSRNMQFILLIIDNNNRIKPLILLNKFAKDPFHRLNQILHFLYLIPYQILPISAFLALFFAQFLSKYQILTHNQNRLIKKQNSLSISKQTNSFAAKILNISIIIRIQTVII